MRVDSKYINAILFPAALTCVCYAAYKTVQDVDKYKSVDDLKLEIAQKDPYRYDSLMRDGVQRRSYVDWQYEVNKMNDSIRTESLAKRAYFEGAQMVKDSIKNTDKNE